MPKSWARLLAVAVTLLSVPAARADALRVGAAVSLKEALGEIAKLYTADSGDTVEFVFGSSGQIAQQIKSGAPMDAFVSAGKKQADDLEKAGFFEPETRRNVAGNRLALIIPAQNTRVKALDDLKKQTVTKIATGEPQTVPAGQYAEQVLKALKLNEAVKGKIVYGTNVRQVLAYVERGEVQAGLVYRSDAMESGTKVTIVANAAENTHEPIVYPAAVLKKSEHIEAAGHFLDFLASDKAAAVLRAKGFTIPTDGPEQKPVAP
jgi:molybdate transport system substrate-binding protein